MKKNTDIWCKIGRRNTAGKQELITILALKDNTDINMHTHIYTATSYTMY